MVLSKDAENVKRYFYEKERIEKLGYSVEVTPASFFFVRPNGDDKGHSHATLSLDGLEGFYFGVLAGRKEKQ